MSVDINSEDGVPPVGYLYIFYARRPLSMSDHLTKMAHKIDFSVDEPGDITEDSATDAETDEKTKQEDKAKFQPSLWPWDSVRNKLKLVHNQQSMVLTVTHCTRSCQENFYILIFAVCDVILL